MSDQFDNFEVVYRTIPTSNHNAWHEILISIVLYIVLFLHQTTTRVSITLATLCCISYYSYIKPQPVIFLHEVSDSCISYYSYIKPQLEWMMLRDRSVVYRTIPTSNHNDSTTAPSQQTVVYRTIPTSNHNCGTISLPPPFVVYRTIPTSNHNL